MGDSVPVAPVLVGPVLVDPVLVDQEKDKVVSKVSLGLVSLVSSEVPEAKEDPVTKQAPEEKQDPAVNVVVRDLDRQAWDLESQEDPVSVSRPPMSNDTTIKTFTIPLSFARFF